MSHRPSHGVSHGVSRWVLLRGLTRECGHWGAFPAELARALPEAHIVCIDLPGAGELRQLRCPLRVEAIVEHCRRSLRDAGVEPPCHLLGLSLGGMVATAWCQAHPQELLSLVLVNTSMRAFSPPQRRLNGSRLPDLLRVLLDRDPQRIESAILRLTSAHPERHADAVAAWQAIRLARPVSVANALRQLLAAAHYRGPVTAPPRPVLVACSTGDALVDPACSRRIAQAWQAELCVHPDAGHDLPLDDGRWLAECIAAWQRRLRSGCSGPAAAPAQRPGDRR